jgi:hypothetical protein
MMLLWIVKKLTVRSNRPPRFVPDSVPTAWPGGVALARAARITWMTKAIRTRTAMPACQARAITREA